MPAFGRVDYCRISCDVSLDWDDRWFMRLTHRERVSTRQAILNTLFRRQLDGRAWRSDPDVVFLREENLKLTGEEKRLLAQVNALLGGVLLTSDDPGRYGPRQREAWRELTELARAEQVRFDADAFCLSYRLDGREYQIQLPKEKLL